MKKIMKYLTLLFIGLSLQVFAVNPEVPNGYDYLARIDKILHSATDISDKSVYEVTIVKGPENSAFFDDEVSIIGDGLKFRAGQFVACRNLKRVNATLCSAEYVINDQKCIENFSVLILGSTQAGVGSSPAEVALQKLLPKPSDDYKIYSLSKAIPTAEDIKTEEFSGYEGEFIVVNNSRDSESSSDNDDGSAASYDGAAANNDDDGSAESSEEDIEIVMFKVKQFAIELRNKARSDMHALDYLEDMINKLRASIDADNQRRKKAGEPLDKSCISARQSLLETIRNLGTDEDDF